MALRRHGVDSNFVRVGAYTGTAAFNVRFGASTLHRLFEMRNPFRWQELQEDSTALEQISVNPGALN